MKGLRPDGRMVLMGISEEPLIVTSEIIGNRSRIIGSMQNGQEYLYEALDYVAKGKVKVIADPFSVIDTSPDLTSIKSDKCYCSLLQNSQ